MFKDKPALHSFCLSNEPNFSRSQDCVSTPKLWAQYLARTHGTVAALNACYGSHYAAFASVPIPGLEQPEYYDYCIFNEQRFAAWHRWMGDVIHSMAPHALVHAKIQLEAAVMSRWYHRSSWGVDPELFALGLDLNGNDCIILEPDGGSPWALQWQIQNMGYDLQAARWRRSRSSTRRTIPRLMVTRGMSCRSISDRPLAGGGSRPEPRLPSGSGNARLIGLIVSTAMSWIGQAAAGGGGDLPGFEPFCRRGCSMQSVKAPVAVVYSGTSMKPDRRYSRSMETVYTALNFSGIKLDFISERQLMAGKGCRYKMIVVPDGTQLLPQAVEVLGRLRGARAVVAGDGLAKDCYGKKTPSGELAGLRAKALLLDAKLTARQIQPLLCRELARLGALPDFQVVDVKTGDAAWGVEWLPVKVGGRTVINAVNLLRDPVSVSILQGQQKMAATDCSALAVGDESRR